MKLKLKYKILLLYVGVSLFILFLIGGLLSSTVRNNLITRISKNYQRELAHIEFGVTSFFRNMELDLDTIAQNELVQSRNDENFASFFDADGETFQYQIGELEQKIISMFNTYRTTHPYVHSVYMGRENGSFLLSSKRARPTRYDPRTSPWYILGKENPGRIMRMWPFRSVTTREISINFVKALLDNEGEVYGVLGVSITLADLMEYISNIKLDYKGFIKILDESGTILVSHDRSLLFTRLESYDAKLSEEIFTRGKGFYVFEKDSEKRYAFFYTSPALGWKFAVIVPMAEIGKEVWSFVYRILIALFLALFLLSGLTLMGLQSFVIKPITKLTEGTDLIAGTGNLDHHIEIQSRDEMGTLAQSFNKMMRSINETESALKESQEELRKHRDHLEELVEERTAELKKLSVAVTQSPASVVITDNRGTIEYVNEAFSEVTGYSAEAAIGQNPRILNSGDLPESYYKNLWSTILSGRIWKGDFINRKKNGEEFWESASISPIKNDEGEITHFVAVKQDITERKQVERTLRESEERHRLFLERLPEPTVVYNMEGKTIFVNPAFEEIFGWSRDELLGKRIDFVPPELEEETKIAIKEMLASGKDTMFFETKRLTKQGERLNVLLSTAPFHDREGHHVGNIVILRDITEQKRAEEALRNSEQRLAQIINFLPDPTWVVDNEGKVLAWNRAMEEISSKKAEDILGKGNYEYALPFYGERRPVLIDLVREWNPDYQKKYISIKKEGGKLISESFHPHLGDSGVYISASAGLLYDASGEVTGAIESIRDITELKETQEELHRARIMADEANKAKGDFLANMTHEIRTPMNAVIGITHLVMKTELTPKQRDYLTKIQSSANTLLVILNDVLDFSKIEAGKLDMESTDFNLDDVLNNVANLTTVKAQEKEDLEVLFSTAQDVPRFLVGDALRLGQVLVNLADNAVKFTESGEMVVSTEQIKRKKDQVTLKFSVSDTGIGLTNEQMENLFQAFTQADTSTTRKYGGTGLGLTISKRLVDMMGGEIWVESELGQGSTFSFTAHFGLGQEKPKKRFRPSPDLRGMKVLLVEDNATARQILKDMLESFSFEVTLAVSGEEGLAELEAASEDTPFELVIMDWKMPGIDGIEASRRIKKHPRLSKIPTIIMVTAHGRVEVMQKAEQAGLEGFLHKPVNPSVLFDTIMQALGEGVPKRPPTTEEEDRLAEGLEGIQGARLLLVEDNEINQQVAKEILEGGGLNVTLANNGQEALDAVRKNEYDAVLMDANMPVMDGYEATRVIRSDQRFKDLPVIAMTAHAMAGEREKSLEAGMNDHVTKPIDPEKLLGTLVKWIKPGKERVTAWQRDVTAERPGPAQATPAGEDLPESLPGFDLEAGLKRLQRNRRLYRKLLLDFAANYSGVGDEIRQALDSKEMERVNGLVHGLKGMAGNLAATDLHSAAVEMET
ncbi:MAG: PAS domain S-box protein, partial [Proteobacteria bacterium]|nr:PAS domain S-box protein [Pseudomonadota bacterium]